MYYIEFTCRNEEAEVSRVVKSTEIFHESMEEETFWRSEENDA